MCEIIVLVCFFMLGILLGIAIHLFGTRHNMLANDIMMIRNDMANLHARFHSIITNSAIIHTDIHSEDH